VLAHFTMRQIAARTAEIYREIHRKDIVMQVKRGKA
jgi:hypothetical protein